MVCHPDSEPGWWLRWSAHQRSLTVPWVSSPALPQLAHLMVPTVRLLFYYLQPHYLKFSLRLCAEGDKHAHLVETSTDTILNTLTSYAPIVIQYRKDLRSKIKRTHLWT